MPLFNSWSYTFLCLAVALIAINQFLLASRLARMQNQILDVLMQIFASVKRRESVMNMRNCVSWSRSSRASNGKDSLNSDGDGEAHK